MYLTAVLFCNSLTTYDIEHFFTGLFAICVSSVVRYQFRSLVHFLIECFVFLLFSFKSFLYILGFFLFLKKFFLFIYFWLHWVFIAAHGLSLVAASGGYSSLQCTGFSLRWLLLLQSTSSRHAGFSSCGAWAR